jgi:hypothetical protein
MRWAKAALCTLALSCAVLPAVAPAAAATAAPVVAQPMVLDSQTPWVTPTTPWLNLDLGIGESAIPAADLHVSMTIYTRVGDFAQYQQSVGGTPDKGVLLHLPSLPVSSTASGRSVATCVTVLPESTSVAPTPTPTDTGVCPANAPTAVLDCTLGTGMCGDAYPISVALLRTGSSTPLARFTTFLTYVEPQAVGGGGALRVGVILPVGGTQVGSVADVLAAHRQAPVTFGVRPTAVQAIGALPRRPGPRPLEQLSDLTSGSGTGSTDQVLSQPYVPINVAALSGAGLGGEVTAQLERGAALLHSAGLHPDSALWVDTASNLTSGDATNLADGLVAAGARQLVLSDGDLASGGLGTYTFAQPFTLDVGHSHLTAAASNDVLSSRFTAHPGDPVLGANQLLGGLGFVHFENAFLDDARGVVVVPPASWRPQSAFLSALLGGLSGNPVLQPVTMDQFFTQVPIGGNREPASRQLQPGAAGKGGFTTGSAQKIAQARQHLSSFIDAVSGHPAVLTRLSDALLATEVQGLSASQRQAALLAYGRTFNAVVGQISLATERTVTFTSRRAPIPITVLSSAPYPVTVVMTLESDKFKFPDGNKVTLHLDRPTTSVRIEAQAVSSGDRLPIDVTLRTPDGQLVVAHAELTVHSTVISIVGIALTVLAGLVLVVWWIRTWRRSRRRRPRAH